MVLITQREAIRKELANRKKLLVAISFGLFCIFIPIICLVVDPLMVFARTKLRLYKGSLAHEALKVEYKGLHIKIYIFNVTNGERFLSGEDEKLKMEEVGPFVYQEYRFNENVEILEDEGLMKYSPRMRAEFILEESIGDPKDFVLNLPNLSLMAISSLLTRFPFLIRKVYDLITLQMNSKPFVKQDVHSYLWDSKDSLLSIANKLVPGLLYYDNIGLLTRLYDSTMEYRLEVGATDVDKFQLKKVTKKPVNRLIENSSNSAYKIYTFGSNTFESGGFTPGLAPEYTRHFYRQGLCKTFDYSYVGNTMLDLNTEGEIYELSNSTFENTYFCDENGTCPFGLMDLSNCFFGTPSGLSKGHFLGADPKLYDRIEGMKPDPEKHTNNIIIEPKLGLTVGGTASIQVNLVMGDMSWSSKLQKFSNMLLPPAYGIVKTPKLPEMVQTKLELMFLVAYKVQRVMQVASSVIGVLLLGYATWQILRKYARNDRNIIFVQLPNSKDNIEAIISY